MILDIRHLKWEEEVEPGEAAAEEEAEQQSSGQIETPVPSCSPGLEELLDAASGEDPVNGEAAMEQLRALVPSREGIDFLCALIDNASDPRRLTAARLLGFHRSWLSTQSGVELLTGWVRKETDSEVGCALVGALRGKTEVREFLHHRITGIAREAALGLPVGKETAPALVRAVLGGCAPGVATILLDKLKRAPGSVAATIAELVVEWTGSTSEKAISALVACLPQVEIFEHFVAERGLPGFDPSPGEEATEILRRWHRLARMVETTMLEEPSAELVRHLVGRCASDDAFARRHASFLTAAIANTGATFGSELLRDLERLATAASEERVVQMAGMLLELKNRLDKRAEPEAEELLEGWKGRSPALNLKIYHMQQGLG